MEKAFVDVVVMVLEKFSNDEILAFNLAIQGFGRIAKKNLSYDSALKALLIQESGTT
jgi:hypothetical protein